mmetsp:Transcript_74304/g.179502  ORF Transcript_74304/g.179502 Transcript_74304/m.179502 type:complete len:206 (+) Transcript_74304:975-1592(+)
MVVGPVRHLRRCDEFVRARPPVCLLLPPRLAAHLLCPRRLPGNRLSRLAGALASRDDGRHRAATVNFTGAAGLRRLGRGHGRLRIPPPAALVNLPGHACRPRTAAAQPPRRAGLLRRRPGLPSGSSPHSSACGQGPSTIVAATAYGISPSWWQWRSWTRRASRSPADRGTVATVRYLVDVSKYKAPAAAPAGWRAPPHRAAARWE